MLPGSDPKRTVAEFAKTVNVESPDVTDSDLPKGTGLVWWRDGREAALRLNVAPSKVQPVRHSRKYAEGELTPDRSFFFRGPEGKLNLRAQNLMTFLQLMDGVDEQTWLHHFQRGEVSAWFRKNIKDQDLADEAGKIERGGRQLSAGQSRALVRELVRARYTIPG